MSNHLSGETSPYLLQHAENPVNWYPWCDEAFARAKNEDKPIFLSIGYSTCHWCHVMAEESFEDAEIAEILNRSFISVKVDREERPDVDSVYMSVCQAFTGSGGWPTSIFMTAGKKPFFAGTYFPKTSRGNFVGFRELLLFIREAWNESRETLLQSADGILSALESTASPAAAESAETLLAEAMRFYRQSFDEACGGFGDAPKFPAPHNLLFLLQTYAKHGDKSALHMAEKALRQMARGGLFDHIGGGFCRYSTDRRFLVPHFEKMLYDNALLISAYCRAFELTADPFYKRIAERTAGYVLREMTAPDGGFYSAQDADSDGVEGKFYVFTPREIKEILGDADGADFCRSYGITQEGNFDGKSIPNLLDSEDTDGKFDALLPKVYAYRQARTRLHLDDKILTAWNSLMIAALCALYRITRDAQVLQAAEAAQRFIENNLCRGDTLFVSFRNGKQGGKGFLDDYASYAFALLALYDATLNDAYLDRARQITDKAVADFFDAAAGGFYLSGKENETLILRPKESYDGAMPSGNALMAYNLTRLQALLPDGGYAQLLQKQIDFLTSAASDFPAGHAMFLCALSDSLDPPAAVTAVKGADGIGDLALTLPSDTLVRVLDAPTAEYKLLDGNTAFYVCEGHACRPPVGKAAFYAALHEKTDLTPRV